MPLLRYPSNHVASSKHDPFIDVVDWFGFLTAKEYLINLIRRVHHVPIKQAATRATNIIPHVRLAVDYIRQSLEGPPDISFLPAYYAMLNLMKVYVLLGPHFASLATSRWHGASYDVNGKDSHSVLTEIVTVRKTGVLPLFYETITHKPLAAKPIRIRIGDILPYVAGVGHEYELATNSPAQLCALSLSYEQQQSTTRPVLSIYHPPTIGVVPVNRLRMLRSFRTLAGRPPNVYIGEPIVDLTKKEQETRNQINAYLIYRVLQQNPVVPISSRKMELPEEWPIVVLFFYMASIVRYRPEFLEGLRDSKFWPIIASARIHSFYAFLMAFWSFMQQQNYFTVE